MITKTYKNLDFSKGSDYEATTENFPRCLHFFPCTEREGKILTDVVGGVEIKLNSMSFPDAYSVKPESAINAPLAKGSWAESGTKKLIVVAVGQLSPLALRIGSTIANDTILLPNGGVNGPVIKADGTQISAEVLTYTGVFAQGFILDIQAVTMESFECNEASGYSKRASVASTGIASVDSIDDVVTLTGTTISQLNSLMVFAADSIPSDMKQVMTWLNHNHQNGNKYLPPHWKGAS